MLQPVTGWLLVVLLLGIFGFSAIGTLLAGMTVQTRARESLLPIIMIVSQFAMQKMTPQPQSDPNQQRMMMLMPLIFGFMFYRLPSGLVLYYLTSNLVSMGQQWFFNHTEAAMVAARSVEPPKKKNGRK